MTDDTPLRESAATLVGGELRYDLGPRGKPSSQVLAGRDESFNLTDEDSL